MKHIILDRDGVINFDSPNYIKSPEEWRALPGSLEAIGQLTRLGYSVWVISNQSGLSRGLFGATTLLNIHHKMRTAINRHGGQLAGILYCPHSDDDNCLCRKPLPGLFTQLAERLGESLNDVPAVGDSLRDLQASQAAGCQPILVQTGNGKKTMRQLSFAVPTYTNLLAYVASIKGAK